MARAPGHRAGTNTAIGESAVEKAGKKTTSAVRELCDESGRALIRSHMYSGPQARAPVVCV